MTNLPEKIYTEAEVERARNTAQLVGWLQGGGVVVGAAILWNLLGWVPVVLGVGALAWIGYKIFGPGRGDGAEGPEAGP